MTGEDFCQHGFTRGLSAAVLAPLPESHLDALPWPQVVDVEPEEDEQRPRRDDERREGRCGVPNGADEEVPADLPRLLLAHAGIQQASAVRCVAPHEVHENAEEGEVAAVEGGRDRPVTAMRVGGGEDGGGEGD